MAKSKKKDPAKKVAEKLKQPPKHPELGYSLSEVYYI